MKKIIASLLLVMLALCAFGCAQPGNSPTALPSTSPAGSPVASPDNTPVKIAVLKGPTAVGAVKLMDDNDAGTTQNKYNFTIAGANEDIVAAVSSGSVDIAAVATNLAANLHKKTNGKIQVVAVNTLGVLYLVENGNAIADIADLRGKTIYSSGQNAVPEYVLNYILESNGLEVGKDVFVEYKSEHSELATLAASGAAEISLLPEPFVSTVLGNNADLRVAINLTEAYADANAKNGNTGDLAMGCIIVRTEWAEKNPDKLEKFLVEYKASTEYAAASENLDATADLCVEYGIIAKKPLAKAAIPNCNIVCRTGADMKTTLTEFYNVLFTANPASIGNQLPPDTFYYMGK